MTRAFVNCVTCGLDNRLQLRVSFCPQSLPSDSQKIRSALGGNLYAYEIPLPTVNCEIKPESPRTPPVERTNESANESAKLCKSQTEENDSGEKEGACRSDGSSESCASQCKGESNLQDNTRHTANRLQVEENWFADGQNGKKQNNVSPAKKWSPKFHRGIGTKLGNTFNLNGQARKSSSSSTESSQGSNVSNSDSGISLGNSPRSRLTVPGFGSYARNSSVSSTASSSPVSGPSHYPGYCFSGFVVAVHRKMVSCGNIAEALFF